MNDVISTASRPPTGCGNDEPRSRQNMLSEAERISLALAHTTYLDRSIRLVNAELSGYSHIVASRQGLFAANERAFRLIAHGLFFGITLRGPSIYLFEACDLPRNPTRRGRVIRLLRTGERIVAADVIAQDLDNGCHQIDFIDGRLCLLDTYNQRVLRFSADEKAVEHLHPLAGAQNRDRSAGYAHMNSLLQVADGVLLLLHNGGDKTGRNSVMALFDLEWQPLARWPLQAGGCHNIAVLEDGTVLFCSSLAGELCSRDGLRVKISTMMTRGLSVGTDCIAVGASTFSSRRGRHLAAGTVTFLDRAFQVRSVLDVPGAPTEIRRLDGRDYSLSAHVAERLLHG